ncbi:SDR family oxidoreductase [Streptomyces sp. TG1A-8]|uniref:SDR family oxidoreductase n=1 Tax=Streptomyces sp. TG1A-8 TaxID=3051385 RepID=UPI00265C073D|nr:SDR family oxidoreductase [Streptomyces sp. TG1A-8]MDO0929529.1 SDR family oxidoreductase [Streptomyces sp. TG1A-8]
MVWQVRAAARLLAARGQSVHVAGRSAARVDSIADIAPELVAHRVDGGGKSAVTELAASLAPIDVLVLTIPSATSMGPLAELDLDAVRQGSDKKVIAMLAVMQAALPHLAERASITLTSGSTAHAAAPGTAAIGAVNAAVEALVRPLAVELAPRRINAVAPRLVDTPWWDFMPEQARTERFAAAEAALPVRHVSTAQEIGEAIAFLATNESVTGTVVQIDGGAHLVQL